MRTDKRGRVRLQRGDRRAGNFVFHMEGGHIKVTPVSGIVSWRVSLGTAAGQLLRTALEGGHDKWLVTYAGSVLSQLCVVPDGDFFRKHAELVNSQVQAHPEYYGKKKPTDDRAEDDRVLEEERQLQGELDAAGK